jgi:hypothetical protein
MKRKNPSKMLKKSFRVHTSNQSMKPMAPARYFATLLATNPAHGLSLAR